MELQRGYHVDKTEKIVFEEFRCRMFGMWKNTLNATYPQRRFPIFILFF